MKRILLLTLTILLLAACSSSAKADLSGEWKLVSYGDAANPTPALPGVETTITFENGQLGGNVGCNSFGGDFKLKGSGFTVGPIMSTLMYCNETAAQEQGVLGMLVEGVGFSVRMDGDLLTITSSDGASVITLARK